METVNDKIDFNLIPTGAFLRVNSLFVNVNQANKLVVAIGDGAKASSSDLQTLEHELERIDITETPTRSDEKHYQLKINIPLQFKEKVHEIGLYFRESEDELSLIAYNSQAENLASTELVLSVEIPDVLPKGVIEGQVVSVGQAQQFATAVDEKKALVSYSANPLEKDWLETVFYQRKVNLEDSPFLFDPVVHIGSVFDGDNRIYLLYKGKICNCIFMGSYNIKAQVVETIYYCCETSEVSANSDAIFGRLTQKNLRCFLAHKTGVFSFNIDLLNNFCAQYNQLFNAPCPIADTVTLGQLAEIPYLIGGDIGRDNSGRAGAVKSVTSDSALIPRKQLSFARDNPLIEFFQNKRYVIGGNRDKTQPPIEANDIDLSDIKNLNDAKQLNLINLQFPKLQSKGNQAYQQLVNINSLTHMHCRVNGKIFIFPNDLFQEEDQPFFIYDLLNETFESKSLSSEILAIALENKLEDYDTVKVVPVGLDIYFCFTKSTKRYFKQRFIVYKTNN